jgi:hypothetical protein
MKGQLTLDYVLSIIIFITLTSYIIFQLLMVVPKFVREVRVQNLRGEAFSISEILLNDPGEPINWHEVGVVERIGLLDETKNLTNFLSLGKIIKFGEICSEDYEKVRSLLATNRTILVSLRNLETDQLITSCSPQLITYRGMKATVVRNFAFVQNGATTYGEMVIEMW